ncbi:phage tail protein [Bordetella avium]|uniref:phage tail protein n=1 Tax=Bordetella avium TaxID=521 RepID=UPI000E68BE5E|nr:phage tail protein [Bordetella avium]RIQ58168.1 phage tail protein [Bordetella avium]RIQ76152.1 phage tail protein [Bordetella avium]
MLLDALTYIIDADNSKLDKAVDKSKQKTDEFGKSMLTAEGRAQIMEDKIKGAFTRIGGAIIAAVAASKALQATAERAQFLEQIRATSEAAGVAVGDVDALGRSVELLGGTSEGARSALEGLASTAYAAMQDVNSSQAKAFKDLKVSLKTTDGQIKSTMQLMGDLADAVKGKDRRKADSLLAGAGITDKATIDLIYKGRQELDRLMRSQKEQGVASKESVERAQRYTEAMISLKQNTGAVRDAFSDMLLPALTWVIEKFDVFVSWFRRHETFVKGFFIAISTVLAVMFAPAAWAAATAIWALLAPILAVALPIAALAALFALLYDDVVNFMEGNDSLIGQIIEKYPMIGQYMKAFGDLVTGVFYLLTGQFSKAGESFESMAETLSAIGGVVVKNLKEMFDGVVKYLSSVWVYISGMFEKVSSVIKKIGKWLGFGGGDDIEVTQTAVSKGLDGAEAQANENMRAAQAQLNQAAASPVNSVTSNAISNTAASRTETNVQVGQVTVQTQATDAQGISKDIGGELKDQLKNVQADSASGVAR